MKKKIILGCVLISMTFISCKKEEEMKVVEEVEKNSTPFSGEAWLKQQVGNQAQPTQQQVQLNQSTNTVPQQTPAGINPPHGQPNHRCDIAVGAPLNSAPSSKTQNNSQPVVKPIQITQPAPVVTQPAQEKSNIVSSSPVVTAPGMNPPHGQEGHRCDVVVGAPLPKS